MELAPSIHEGYSEGKTVPGSRANGTRSLGRRFRINCISFKTALFLPLWTGPFSISMHFHEQLRRISGGRNTCVEQTVFALSQVLGWGLLGSPSAVQQFLLQQRQVGLEEWNKKRTKRKVCSLLELARNSSIVTVEFTGARTRVRTFSPISGEMSLPNCCRVVRKRFNLLSCRAPQVAGNCWLVSADDVEEAGPLLNLCGGDGAPLRVGGEWLMPLLTKRKTWFKCKSQ